MHATRQPLHRSPNSALEQAASAARPWQAAQGKTQARGGPRPVPRPPLLTASVTQILFVVHERLTRRRALQGIIFLPVG